MSGVTGVLLSYGGSGGVGPFPGVEPAFILTNLDTATISFNYGCSTLTKPNISDWQWFLGIGLDNVVEKFSGKAYPLPNPDIYPDPNAVDYGQDCFMWGLRDGELFCSIYPTQSESVPIGVNFANYFAQNPEENVVGFWAGASLSGSADPYEALGSNYTIVILPYIGGFYNRDAYDSDTLIQVGGTSGSSVSYTRYWDPDLEFEIPVPPAGVYSALYLEYTLSEKTLRVWTASQFPNY